MGRKRTGPGPGAPERNRQFAEHLSALMQSAGLTAPELASAKSDGLDRRFTSTLLVSICRGLSVFRNSQKLNLDTARRLLPDGW